MSVESEFDEVEKPFFDFLGRFDIICNTSVDDSSFNDFSLGSIESINDHIWQLYVPYHSFLYDVTLEVTTISKERLTESFEMLKQFQSIGIRCKKTITNARLKETGVNLLGLKEFHPDYLKLKKKDEMFSAALTVIENQNGYIKDMYFLYVNEIFDDVQINEPKRPINDRTRIKWNLDHKHFLELIRELQRARFLGDIGKDAFQRFSRLFIFSDEISVEGFFDFSTNRNFMHWTGRNIQFGRLLHILVELKIIDKPEKGSVKAFMHEVLTIFKFTGMRLGTQNKEESLRKSYVNVNDEQRGKLLSSESKLATTIKSILPVE